MSLASKFWRWCAGFVDMGIVITAVWLQSQARAIWNGVAAWAAAKEASALL
jgi:hypothetical protein